MTNAINQLLAQEISEPYQLPNNKEIYAINCINHYFYYRLNGTTLILQRSIFTHNYCYKSWKIDLTDPNSLETLITTIKENDTPI